MKKKPLSEKTSLEKYLAESQVRVIPVADILETMKEFDALRAEIKKLEARLEESYKHHPQSCDCAYCY